MALYLATIKYTAEAHAAVRQAGHTTREAAVRGMAEGLGGSLVSMYWAVSPDFDFIAIMDLPNADDELFTAMTAEASGIAVRGTSHRLWSSEEAEAISKRTAAWQPPTAAS